MVDILVIDDDEMMVEIISDILLDEGYSVRSAPDGFRGLEEVGRGPPALVVLDMNMPGMDGYEVASRLRRHHGSHGMRILAVTGDISKAAAEAARASGCDALVTKPIDPDELVSRVAELVLAG